MIRTLVGQSAHPLSRRLSQYLADSLPMAVENFTELPGLGLVSLVDNWLVKAGSASFLGTTEVVSGPAVHISI